MTPKTKRILVPALFVAGAMIAACGSRYTTQEAYDACDALLDRIDTAESEETFAECVACFEDCGEECEQTEVSPATFACPDD
jgi:hypothetical protein